MTAAARSRARTHAHLRKTKLCARSVAAFASRCAAQACRALKRRRKRAQAAPPVNSAALPPRHCVRTACCVVARALKLRAAALYAGAASHASAPSVPTPPMSSLNPFRKPDTKGTPRTDVPLRLRSQPRAGPSACACVPSPATPPRCDARRAKQRCCGSRSARSAAACAVRAACAAPPQRVRSADVAVTQSWTAKWRRCGGKRRR